jgi:hypothetical protein
VPPQTVAVPHIVRMARVLGPRNPVMLAFIKIAEAEGIGELKS